MTEYEIFQYLKSADKPCLVAIDEFQTIMDYPEHKVEALLRTYIQECNNAWFVFSGSKRHMMGESMSALLEKDIVTNNNGQYYIYDYFLY